MAYGNQTAWHRDTLPKPEFLSYPLDTSVLDSATLNPSNLTADASGPYKGRIYLLQGTILSKRADSTYERYTGAAEQNIAGILFDTVEFPDTSAQSKTAAAYVRRNVSFNKTNIVDYATHETALKAALSTCEFI